MRESRRRVAGTKRGSDDASADSDVEPGADVDGDRHRDAITHAESDGRRRVADAHRDERTRKRDGEPLAGRGGESRGDGGGQRNELPALRDADRDRLPRPALAVPLARRSAPLGATELDEPGGQQRDRFDEVVDEMQVRSRDRKTPE